MAGDDDRDPKAEETASSDPPAAAAAAAQESEDATKTGAEEEDTGAHVAPIIKLEEVSISSGEENEDTLLDLKAKMYRFHKEGNQWKERGVGQVRLLKHKESGKIRLLMRQNKTLKICANHMLLPTTTLQEHAGSDKSWVWHATDYSDGELKDELFCIRLGNVENAQKFKASFEEAQKAMSVKSEANERAADSAAEALENLKVDEKEVQSETACPAEEKETIKTEIAE